MWRSTRYDFYDYYYDYYDCYDYYDYHGEGGGSRNFKKKLYTPSRASTAGSTSTQVMFSEHTAQLPVLV